MSDVILTGIPRAGTTLAAALVDSLPDTVCLNEPGWHNAKAASDAEGFASFIADDFTRLRKCLLAAEPIPDRRGKDGGAITNYYATGTNGIMQEQFSVVPFVRTNLSNDFTLTIKHNGPYLAVLPELVAHGYKIIAIIRDPLPVIRSWRRLQLPISRGDLPNAKIYWQELKTLIDTPMDLLEKHVRIYELMLARILQYEAQITVIDYDDLVQNPLLIAGALGKKNVHLPSLVQPQKVQQGKEDAQIISMLRRYALLACGRWPR